jgi:hypothetical protein
MSKKSFAVGTGAMNLRLLLADIMGGFRFKENCPYQEEEKATQNDVLCRPLNSNSQCNRFGSSLCPRGDFHYIESNDEGNQQLHLGGLSSF